jgi:hypothetical protein
MYSYVIVNLGPNKKQTQVRKESFRIKDDSKPSSYAEAALWQDPDIESKLDNLCQELAKCSIHQDVSGLFAVIQKNLTKATAKQASLGSKAICCHVEFTED